MKKLALSLAVLFAVGMVSCGGNKEKEECNDSCVDTTVAVEEGAAVLETPDSVAVAVDSVAVEAPVEEPKAE